MLNLNNYPFLNLRISSNHDKVEGSQLIWIISKEIQGDCFSIVKSLLINHGVTQSALVHFLLSHYCRLNFLRVHLQRTHDSREDSLLSLCST